MNQPKTDPFQLHSLSPHLTQFQQSAGGHPSLVCLGTTVKLNKRAFSKEHAVLIVTHCAAEAIFYCPTIKAVNREDKRSRR
jgi:hypothetical protein